MSKLLISNWQLNIEHISPTTPANTTIGEYFNYYVDYFNGLDEGEWYVFEKENRVCMARRSTYGSLDLAIMINSASSPNNYTVFHDKDTYLSDVRTQDACMGVIDRSTGNILWKSYYVARQYGTSTTRNTMSFSWQTGSTNIKYGGMMVLQNNHLKNTHHYAWELLYDDRIIDMWSPTVYNNVVSIVDDDEREETIFLGYDLYSSSTAKLIRQSGGNNYINTFTKPTLISETNSTYLQVIPLNDGIADIPRIYWFPSRYTVLDEKLKTSASLANGEGIILSAVDIDNTSFAGLVFVSSSNSSKLLIRNGR